MVAGADAATFHFFDLTSNLRAIGRLIRPYGSRRLLRQLAALQLLPDNAHVLGLLEGTCGACLTHGRDGREATVADLEHLALEGALTRGALVRLDDPHEHLFTEPFPYHAGDHPVFPGPVMGGVQPLSLLTQALHREPDVFGEGFLSTVTALISAVLTISIEVIRRSGLPVPEEPRGRHWQDAGQRGALVAVPPEDHLHRLEAAVTLTPLRLRALLSEEEHAALRLLTMPFGPPPREAGALAVQRFPLVDLGEHLIVAGPHALLSATASLVLELARQAGEADQLTAQVSLALQSQVQLALMRLGAEPVPIQLPDDTPTARHLLYQLDADKLLHVITVTQDVASVGNAPKETWVYRLPERPLSANVEAHDVMTLVVFAEHGQRFRLQGGAAWTTHLLVGLRADDLDLLATAHRGDATTLWRYGESRAALRQATRVHTSNPIDELAALSDLGFPQHFPLAAHSSLLVSSRTGATWRRRLTRQRDARLAPWIDGQTLVLVERSTGFHPDVYVPVVPVHPRPHLAVPWGAGTLWVLAGDDSPTGAAEAAPTLSVESLVQGVAAWLAELHSVLSTRPNRLIAVVIHQSPEHEKSLAVHDATHRFLHLRLGAPFFGVITRPENLAERHLVALLTQGLQSTMGEELNQRRLRRVVNRVAPRGDKRLFMAMSVSRDAELDPRGLERVRYLQPAQAQAWQVWVGTRLARHSRWKLGTDIPASTDALREANGLLFAELQRRVQAYDGEALLRQLLAQYEALRHEVATLTHTQVSRRLMFGPHATPMPLAADDTATALRFLLELVAAEPPHGSRPASLLGLDELIGLGVCLIHYGFVSDALHYRLGRVTARLDLNGALLVDAPEYGRAVGQLASAANHRAAQEANASRYGEPLKGTDDDPRPEWIEALCEALYGLTVAQLMRFMNTALDIGEDCQGRPTVLPLEAFESAMQRELGWPDELFHKALHLLSLGPRPDFFAVPQGMARSEVYPWQYSRELSFLRRPLILLNLDGQPHVAWGNRALESSKKYWLYGRLLSGRIQLPSGDSPARRAAAQALKRLTSFHSKGFNAEVLGLARSAGFQALLNVKRFGRLRMLGEDGTLGDIDVLVIDPAMRRLILVECKDYAPARTPFELSSQLDELLRGRPRTDGTRARSLIERHARRAAFVENHLHDVLAGLGCDTTVSWSVFPIYVMSALPNALLAADAPFPLVDVADFPAWLMDSEMVPDSFDNAR